MTQGEIASISRARHEAGRCGGFIDLTDFQEPLTPRAEIVPLEVFTGPAQGNLVRPLLEHVSAANIHDTVEHLQSYKTRHHATATGAQAAEWIRDRFKELAAGRDDVTVELFAHTWVQSSVIARIQGQGEHANEIIVIGGHEDSINHTSWHVDPEALAPGADDDASGVATLMETFRVLVQSGYKPDRTIEFMTYSAEEVGLWGSQAISRDYRAKNKNVVAVLQFDMTLFPGSGDVVAFVSDYVNQPLTQFTQRLMDEYVGIPWKEDPCGYACSDHASWHRAGYPAAFPFEAMTDEMNNSIHTPKDLLSKLSPDHGAQFSKLGVAFAVELATSI